MGIFLINKYKGDKKSFEEKVVKISVLLGINPDWLMGAMWHESKLNPQAKHPKGSATGLIQFIETTAKSLGTSTADLFKMDGVVQMDYVYQYLKPYKGKMKSQVDVYLAIFYPAAINKTDDFKFPSNVVKWNPIFDRFPKDGILTKGELKKHLDEYFKSIK